MALSNTQYLLRELPVFWSAAMTFVTPASISNHEDCHEQIFRFSDPPGCLRTPLCSRNVQFGTFWYNRVQIRFAPRAMSQGIAVGISRTGRTHTLFEKMLGILPIYPVFPKSILVVLEGTVMWWYAAVCIGG